MAYNERSLDDYVDVAQRIADFRDLYPSGSLQPADPARPWEQAIVTGTDKNGQAVTQTFIVYTAAAYRTPMTRGRASGSRGRSGRAAPRTPGAARS